jgi:hypothetical protein
LHKMHTVLHFFPTGFVTIRGGTDDRSAVSARTHGT